MRLFKCFVYAGDDVFKAYVTSKAKKDILKDYLFDGEILKVEDITSNHLNQDSIKALEIDLVEKGWEEAERVLILGLVQQHLDSRK